MKSPASERPQFSPSFSASSSREKPGSPLRRLAVIENFQPGTGIGPDIKKTTRFEYKLVGSMTKLIAENPTTGTRGIPDPPSTINATYLWSTNLARFLAGTTVTFTTQADAPLPGFTTVIATVTGTATSKLVFRIAVTQN